MSKTSQITGGVINLIVFFVLSQMSVVANQWHALHVLNLRTNITQKHNIILYPQPTATEEYSITCEASYPIQWSFYGVLAPKNVKWASPRRNLAKSEFYIGLELFFEHSADDAIATEGALVRIACEEIEKTGNVKSVLVFPQGDSNSTLFVSSSKILDSTLIPCLTTDPFTRPSLFKRNGERGEESINDTSLQYIFNEGFRSTQVFDGVYICRQGDTSVTIFASVSKSNKNDIEFAPNSDSLRVFTEDTIQFKCTSKSGEKKFKLTCDDIGGTVSVSYNTMRDTAIVQVSEHFPSATYTNELVKKLQGTCNCTEIRVDAGNVMDSVFKVWSYEFVETPELFLDNSKREISCLSNIKNTSVHAVWCKNKMECSFLSNSLKNMTPPCNYPAQIYFSSKTPTYCIRQNETVKRPCVPLEFPYSSGLVMCYVDGLVKTWEFFTSLDFRKYANWRKIKESEKHQIVQIKKMPSENGITQFVCSAVAYLFADSLFFEIEYSNGSIKSMEHDSSNQVKYLKVYERDPRKISGLNVIATINISLSDDMVGIHCIAPWWNSTKYVKSIQIDLTEPVIYTVVGAIALCIDGALLALVLLFMKRYREGL